MKAIFVLLLTTLMIAQSGQLQAQYNNDYYHRFIELWGILKYNTQPKNEEPCYWNDVFLQTLPEMTTIESDEAFYRLVDKLLTEHCLPAKQETKRAELLNGLNFPDTIQQAIYLYVKKPKVDLGPDKNVDFTLDNTCVVEVQSRETELLGVARLWNMLYYFHPNRSANFREILAQALANLPSKGLDLTLIEMMRAFEDNHAHVYTATSIKKLMGESYYPLIKVQYTGQVYTLYSPDYKLYGDTLHAINHIQVSTIADSLIKWLPNTGRISHRNLSYYLLSGAKGSNMLLTLNKANDTLSVACDKNDLSALYHYTSLTEKLSENVTYCNVLALTDTGKEKQAYREMQEADTLILDLRGHVNHYPNYLLKKWKFKANKFDALTFDKRKGEAIQTQHTVVKGKDKMSKTVYVLIDKYTQSSSEILTMRLMNNSCRVIGENSAGAIGLTSTYAAAKKVKVYLTIKKYTLEKDFWSTGIPPLETIPAVTGKSPKEVYSSLKQE